VTAGQTALVQAVTATAAFANGLFFVRFWQRSRDRLFGYFGAAFWLLAVSWMLLATINPEGDARAYIYGLRLVAFLLLIVGMIDKNRRRQ
jgi:hypothetical protein